MNLVNANLMVLRKLYDCKEGAFNCRIYACNNGLTRLIEPLHKFNIIPFNLIPPILPRPRNCVRIEAKKDLKYIGYACVGLLWYIASMSRKDEILNQNKSLIIDMVKNSIEYLSSFQTSSGYLRCRYVFENQMEEGRDKRSIAEATNAFLWAAQTACNFNILKEGRVKEKISIALDWLWDNKKFLVPQEKSRLIYGIVQIHGFYNDVSLERQIKLLGKDLISELSNLRSFGSFPNDIDAIGALSSLYLLTRNPIFRDFSKNLVYNQIRNQGSNGQWRRVFHKKSGNWIPILDTTYTAHQIGMAPFALSLYLVTSDTNDTCHVSESIRKGIRWVVLKKAILRDFIIRSFSGLTGNVYEFEQRSYEPGLNILGLLSYYLYNGMKAKNIAPQYLLFPWKIADDYGFRLHELLYSPRSGLRDDQQSCRNQ